MDVLIRNVTIVDGSGNPARVGNVGIEGGRLLVDPTGTADTVIDGT